MIFIDLTEIVQEKFDTFIKLNYRCEKGKYVPDSFSCGETKEEAAKNIKIEKKLKREAEKVKKEEKKAKKEAKSSKNPNVGKVAAAIKNIEEEKSVGKVSVESVNELKDALGSQTKETNPVKTLADYIKADHVIHDPKVIESRSKVDAKLKEEDAARAAYSAIKMSKETTKERHAAIAKVEKLRIERDALIEVRYNIEKALILQDLSKMTPEERSEYKRVAQKAVREQTEPKTEEDRLRSGIQMTQLYTAVDYIKKHDDATKNAVFHNKFKTVEEAEKEFGTIIAIEEESAVKNMKVSMDTLNQFGKARATLLSEFPELKKVDVQEIELCDTNLGSAMGTWNDSQRKLQFRYNATLQPKSTYRFKKNDIRGFAVDGIIGIYNHEMGHAVHTQLFTNEEKDAIVAEWKERKLPTDDNFIRSWNGHEDRIKHELSSYAVTNSDECVAEMFAKMTIGKEVNRDTLPSAYDAISRILRRKE